MREALYANIKATYDVALFPEGMFHDEAKKHGVTPADLTRKPGAYPVDEIRKSADLLLNADLKADDVIPMLNAKLPAQRFWAALSCLYNSQ